MAPSESEIRIEVERGFGIGQTAVRATHGPSGLFTVVASTGDRHADEEKARAELGRLLIDVAFVRNRVATGTPLEDIARELVVGRGRSPIPAIKAIRHGAHVGVGEAKFIVHPQLPPSVKEAAERLWDQLEAAMESDEWNDWT